MNTANFLRPPADPFFWEEIISFGAAQGAPTGVTTLVALSDYGSPFRALAWVVKNDDASNQLTMQADVSQGGVGINSDLQQQRVVPAGEERMIMMGSADDRNPCTYHRLQVNNAGASLLIRFALLGIRR